MNVEASIPTHGPDESDPRPIVPLPRTGIPGAAIAVIAVIGAILLFLLLDGRRQLAATGQQQGEVGPAIALSPPPPLTIPRELPPPASFVTIYPPGPASQTAIVTPPQQRLSISPAPQSYSEPAVTPLPPPPDISLVQQSVAPPLPILQTPPSYDGPAVVIGSAVAHGSMGPPVPLGPAPTSASQQTGEQNATIQQPASFTRMANPATLMLAGTLIPAVLETPIDTARPGLVRAIVSKDARGFGGRQVLVPKGSRLIGEYQSDVGPSQNRVLVSWTRLIRPDGVTIQLAAPATDQSGGAGVPGRVHGFFLTRFVNAAFQTALAVGENLATRQTNTVIVGVPTGTVTNVAGQPFAGASSPRRKITVKQGTLVNVFVAQDLDFSATTTGS